jgi:[protein-PII] uridylyltransferase
MNIVRGQAFANSHGLILDLIEFEDRLQTFKLNRSEMDAFQKTLREVVLGRQDLTVLLKKRESSILFQSKSWSPIQTFVGFDDHASDRYTLMEIVTRDRFGLLYTIATTLARNDCNIDVALISTEGHKAIDVFYLTQAGQKLTSLPQQMLEKSLHQALDRP